MAEGKGKMGASVSPQIISDDISRSFGAWAKREVERVKNVYGLTEVPAVSAIALTVLGSCVGNLQMIGKSTEHIISIIKGMKPS